MKASKQALGAAAMLAFAAGPAAADSTSTTMSVSVQVVAPGSLSGAVVGPGQDSLAPPVGAAAAASPRGQETAVPPSAASRAGDAAVQQK